MVSILHKELERYKWKNVKPWSCRSCRRSSEAVIHLDLWPWWMTFSSICIILRIILCLIQYLLIEYWSLSFIDLVVKDKGKITTKHHLHISHNAPYLPPKILHSRCFSFLLGITAFLREIENNACAEFWGANKVHYGRCEGVVCK